MKQFVVLLLVSSVSAFRPPTGSVPWHKEISSSTWVKPDWDVDYFVPNFGVDDDIKSTQSHTAVAEDKLKHVMHASFKKPKEHPKDYFVPNFGVDHDIALSIKHTDEAENSLGHVMQASFKKPKGHDMDYFVPNFGVDGEIKDAQNNLASSEDKLKTKFTASFKKPKGPPQDYFVPDFGLDQDVKDTQANVAQQEKLHGAWTPAQDENGSWEVPAAADNASYSYN